MRFLSVRSAFLCVALSAGTAMGMTVRTTTATCEGTVWRNGFYGEGLVNAERAVGIWGHHR